MYEEEYKDCKSLKSRFHQYFIHGESVDCHQWKHDYNSCLRYERDQSDLKSAKEVIDSEIDRRSVRMQAHYDNNIWHKRSSPPPDWDRALPDWLVEKNQNTYLSLKSSESTDNEYDNAIGNKRTMCLVM